MGFLGLCDLVSKKRHKATTPNCVPQRKDLYGSVVCKVALCLACCSNVASSYKQYE